jgi:Ca2+-binding EF-hand superfamily protein
MMNSVFESFADGDHEITAKELNHAFKKYGWNDTSDEEIAALMAEYDLDGNNVLTFKEFKQIILDPD